MLKKIFSGYLKMDLRPIRLHFTTKLVKNTHFRVELSRFRFVERRFTKETHEHVLWYGGTVGVIGGKCRFKIFFQFEVRIQEEEEDNLKQASIGRKSGNKSRFRRNSKGTFNFIL